MKTDPRVDAYIQKSAPFAQPILKLIRAAVHEGAPDAEETIRWQMPSFSYGGRILCQMAAFKAHCAFGFWKGTQIVNAHAEEGMGQFGKITKLEQLPSKKALVGYVKKATKLHASLPPGGSSVIRGKSSAPKKAKPVPKMPADLGAALAKNNKAHAHFEKFAPSHKREYIEWITSAKQQATREKRLATAIAQIAEGKPQNWKYM